MLTIKRLVITICCAQLMVVEVARAQTATVEVSLEKNVITQHEPAIVDLTVVNLSATTVRFDPGYDASQIEITVIDPDGHVAKKTPRLKQGMSFSYAFDVTPAATGLASFVLNDWFVLNKVGNYEIDINAPEPYSLPGTVGSQRSALTLTVMKRNQARLEEACASLVSRLEESGSASSATTAARALAQVDDPAAVSYMAEAMKVSAFRGMMIEALARLRTDSALAALVAASHSSDAEERNLASSALASLGVTNH